MATLLDWLAAGDEGELRREGFRGYEYPAASPLLPASVREVRIATDQGDLRARVREGERVGVFTRRMQRVNLGSLEAEEPEGVVVVEVVPDPERPDRFVRLYIGREILISTEDVYG